MRRENIWKCFKICATGLATPALSYHTPFDSLSLSPFLFLFTTVYTLFPPGASERAEISETTGDTPIIRKPLSKPRHRASFIHHPPPPAEIRHSTPFAATLQCILIMHNKQNTLQRGRKWESTGATHLAPAWKLTITHPPGGWKEGHTLPVYLPSHSFGWKGQLKIGKAGNLGFDPSGRGGSSPVCKRFPVVPCGPTGCGSGRIKTRLRGEFFFHWQRHFRRQKSRNFERCFERRIL